MAHVLYMMEGMTWLQTALVVAAPFGLTDDVQAEYDRLLRGGGTEGQAAWGALHARDLIPEASTGAHGWPLLRSKTYPGETTLGCPACLGTNVTMGASYAATGTGLGGCGRMGDPGSREWVRCNDCGRTATKEARGVSDA